MKTKIDDTRFKNWLVPICIPICGLILIILIVAFTGYFGSSILPFKKEEIIMCNSETCPFFENFGSYIIVGILVYCYIGLIISVIVGTCFAYFMIADLIRQFMYGHESIMHE